tara:strand:+ start:1263 stop:1391 length:129 start_codon:yes stop_codon:yes gene_type:complete
MENPIELVLSLEDVEYLISYLEEIDDAKTISLADEIRTQTYA